MSTNLDKLMQMATLEQMNNMIQQMNKKTESEAKDVLSLPIVQKVIMAYEDELKVKKASNECKCNCKCDELIPTILGHLNDHNLKLQLIENRLNGLFTLLENREPEKPVIDKNQTKLTSFPGFGEIPEVIKNVSLQKSFLPEENSLESQQSCLESQQSCLEKENITLNIEETEPENNNIDIIEDFDDEDIQESTDTEDVDQVQTETVEEEDKSEEEDEAVEEEDEEAAEDKVAIEDEAVEEEEDEEDDESHENVSTEEEVATEDELEDQVELIKEDETVEEDEAVEDEEDEAEEDKAEKDEAEEDEAEEEVFEIEIDDITYFATDEENGILYEVDKDGEVGKKVGIIKDGEPIFS